MTPGNTIDLTGIDYDSTGNANLVGNELQVTENGQTYDFTLSGIPSNEFFHLGRSADRRVTAQISPRTPRRAIAAAR